MMPHAPHVGKGKQFPTILYNCPTYMSACNAFYESLTELNLDTNNKSLLSHTIYHGTDTNMDILLEIMFKFLKHTQLFV